MVTIEKCDGCKKTITGQYVSVTRSSPYIRFQFCNKCARPIANSSLLKKYKLLSTP
jgi:hypothetical protein